VSQLTCLYAGSTTPARIIGLTVFAVEIRSKSQSQSQVGTAVWPYKQLSMSHMVVSHRLNQRILQLLMSYYFGKLQNKND
jgi:hypothetical protein